jgi:glucokinase
VEFFAVGHYGAVALDAQYKFLRFGVSSNAYTDPRLQVLAANVLGPKDVAVIISSSGRIDDLLAVADIARQRGAAVLAITASQSPLAKQGRRGADRRPCRGRGDARADGQPHPAPGW